MCIYIGDKFNRSFPWTDLTGAPDHLLVDVAAEMVPADEHTQTKQAQITTVSDGEEI